MNVRWYSHASIYARRGLPAPDCGGDLYWTRARAHCPPGTARPAILQCDACRHVVIVHDDGGPIVLDAPVATPEAVAADHARKAATAARDEDRRRASARRAATATAETT